MRKDTMCDVGKNLGPNAEDRVDKQVGCGFLFQLSVTVLVRGGAKESVIDTLCAY